MVTYNIVSSQKHVSKMEDIFSTFEQLQKSPLVNQLLGQCTHSYVTQYHKYRDGTGLKFAIQHSKVLQDISPNQLGIQLCLEYAQIVNLTHSNSNVICKSDTVDHILSNLVITDDVTFLLNDIKHLAVVKDGKAKCEIQDGAAMAPEEKIPHALGMHMYDIKSDIWKIPLVCNHILNRCGAEDVKSLVKEIHRQCQNEDSKSRPTAAEVVQEYAKIAWKF